jgi:hypothetical protein
MTQAQLEQIKLQAQSSLEGITADYKDVGEAIEDAILSTLDPQDPILETMPSALDCPRAFSEWWAKHQ